MQRTAEARWTGDLKSGKGSIGVGSGAFDLPYSFISRFEGSKDTNPEELIGAAHAACYSMALSHALATAGKAPTSVETTAKVQIEKDAPPSNRGFSISRIDLVTRGKVPGLSAAEFQKFAEDTKQNCIVSRALAAVPMTLDAKLA
jgi:osmotically inducible protein OsmC